eukprot:TRINITY_DN2754_c0_g1_i4.p1 TRINITY_DN2754_c0_g1~~TRINITY_DN2754_c0_g1_i4.p1  ORF type:complete len:1047 (+),score=292.82 TRINITY_DN2754_c0_g1_i4:77-3217(+)
MAGADQRRGAPAAAAAAPDPRRQRAPSGEAQPRAKRRRGGRLACGFGYRTNQYAFLRALLDAGGGPLGKHELLEAARRYSDDREGLALALGDMSSRGAAFMRQPRNQAISCQYDAWSCMTGLRSKGLVEPKRGLTARLTDSGAAAARSCAEEGALWEADLQRAAAAPAAAAAALSAPAAAAAAAIARAAAPAPADAAPSAERDAPKPAPAPPPERPAAAAPRERACGPHAGPRAPRGTAPLTIAELQRLFPSADSAVLSMVGQHLHWRSPAVERKLAEVLGVPRPAAGRLAAGGGRGQPIDLDSESEAAPAVVAVDLDGSSSEGEGAAAAAPAPQAAAASPAAREERPAEPQQLRQPAAPQAPAAAAGARPPAATAAQRAAAAAAARAAAAAAAREAEAAELERELSEHRAWLSQPPLPAAAEGGGPAPAAQLPRGSEIAVLVDCQERRNYRDAVPRLQERGVRAEERKLHVGDMLWVARTPDGREMVLDLVLERKEALDLYFSVTKNGRLVSQKRALHRCGLRRVMFVIEGVCPSESPQQRSMRETVHASLLLKDGFSVCRTADFSDTLSLVAALTRQLERSAGCAALCPALPRAPPFAAFSRILPPHYFSEDAQGLRLEQPGFPEWNRECHRRRQEMRMSRPQIVGGVFGALGAGERVRVALAACEEARLPSVLSLAIALRRAPGMAERRGAFIGYLAAAGGVPPPCHAKVAAVCERLAPAIPQQRSHDQGADGVEGGLPLRRQRSAAERELRQQQEAQRRRARALLHEGKDPALWCCAFVSGLDAEARARSVREVDPDLLFRALPGGHPASGALVSWRCVLWQAESREQTTAERVDVPFSVLVVRGSMLRLFGGTLPLGDLPSSGVSVVVLEGSRSDMVHDLRSRLLLAQRGVLEVRCTASPEETAQCLAKLHRQVAGAPYRSSNRSGGMKGEGSVLNQALRRIPEVTDRRADSIQAAHHSLPALLEAYSAAGDAGGALLADLVVLGDAPAEPAGDDSEGGGDEEPPLPQQQQQQQRRGRRLGPALSQQVWRVFCAGPQYAPP